MGALHRLTCRRCLGRTLAASAVLAPVAAAFAARPARAQAGEPRSTRSTMLDAGASMLQSKRPVDAMSAYLNGFHFYADDMGRVVEAFHYCTHLTEDFHQCVIFDSDRDTAKLIGIEYIVSERLFRSLPADEKRLWHSHDYEVASGQLVAPGLPRVAEYALMRDLVTTYGKTWHTWQIDRDGDLPLGIPQLMMGFTADGQLDPKRLEARNQRLDTPQAALRQERGDIPAPSVDAGANAWQSGRTMQLTLQEMAVRGRG
ncbi:conserved exported protein of unknown function [Rhodovastum atsumiense]|uniref:DUF1264 domain-containing protein n=1 Tax=Rhodovastum atsumiense TaxID=504468 RepID=A0A5M6IP89_9PROT|nr:OBAP family protein [Rhodovastum atsumiense]KAA5610076.1 DUF1264 domain-containing protein [Rhodovastum atsumiense]CAH2601455.1 conserved exported protein of unknown function [Rhodovastum atsumiense]